MKMRRLLTVSKSPYTLIVRESSLIFRVLATRDFGRSGCSLEAFAGMRHLNVFDRWPLGSFMKDDIFAAETDIFAEGEADPIIGEEESFTFDGLVSGEYHAVKVLYFSFGVFGAQENFFESWNCFAFVDGGFDEKSFVQVEAIEVIDDFESALGVAGMLPGEIVHSDAFDKVVVLSCRIVFECFDDGGEVGRLDTNVLIASIFKLLKDEIGKLLIEEIQIGS